MRPGRCCRSRPSQPPGPPPSGPAPATVERQDGGAAAARSSAWSCSSALLGVVTAAGIAIGRAVEPAHHDSRATAPRRPGRPPRFRLPPAPRPVAQGHVQVGAADGPALREAAGRPAECGRCGRRAQRSPSSAAPGRASSSPARSAGSSCRSRVSRGPRASAQAFELGGNLYVLGGEQGGQAGRRRAPDRPRDRPRAAPSRGSRSRSPRPASCRRGKAVYLVGGWTGEKYATAILKFSPPSTVSLVGAAARRPPLAGGRAASATPCTSPAAGPSPGRRTGSTPWISGRAS